MGSLALDELDVFRAAEALADSVWDIVKHWDSLSRDTVGKQMVRAADSVGANIAEGFGRRSYQDNRRFIRIARGSVHETRFWLRRAYRRGLLTDEQQTQLKPLISRMGPLLNGYLRSIGRAGSKAQRTTDE